MSSSDGPHSRAELHGYQQLSAQDLLALIVTESDEEAVRAIPVATDLVGTRGIAGLRDLGLGDLQALGQVEQSVGRRILAALELGRRIGLSAQGPRKQIAGARDVAKYFRHLELEAQEHFAALFLNMKNHILCSRTIHVGTLNMSVVGTREVYRHAIREGAAALIVVHNHPSGDPEPSPEDIQITQHLKEVGELLDIRLVDHVIIGHHRHFSFKEKRLL